MTRSLQRLQTKVKMNKTEAIKNSLVRITQSFSTWNLKKANKKLKSKGLPVAPLIQKTSVLL